MVSFFFKKKKVFFCVIFHIFSHSNVQFSQLATLAVRALKKSLCLSFVPLPLHPHYPTFFWTPRLGSLFISSTDFWIFFIPIFFKFSLKLDWKYRRLCFETLLECESYFFLICSNPFCLYSYIFVLLSFLLNGLKFSAYLCCFGKKGMRKAESKSKKELFFRRRKTTELT